MKCDTCGNTLPKDKFNEESYSPETCFKCRVNGVRLGFSAGRQNFHGDHLVGGTIASDNRHTVSQARANGHDPVPLKTAGGVGVSRKELDRLKKIV